MFLIHFFFILVQAEKIDNQVNYKPLDYHKYRTRERNYRTFESIIYCSLRQYLEQEKIDRDKKNFQDKIDEEKENKLEKEIIIEEPILYNEKDKKTEIKKKKNNAYFTYENFICGLLFALFCIFIVISVIYNYRKYGRNSFIIISLLILSWPFRRIFRILKLCYENEDADMDIWFPDGEMPELL